MKKRVSIVLLLVISLMLASCNLFRPAAKDTVTGMMDAFKNGDSEQTQKYFSKATDKETSAEESADLDSSMMEPMLLNLSYKIISSTEENDNATVVVEITNKDMKSIFQKYLTALFAAAFSGEYADMSEEEQDERRNELLSKTIEEEENFVTTSVSLELAYDGKEWKIIPNMDLVTAVLGGLDLSKITEGEAESKTE